MGGSTTDGGSKRRSRSLCEADCRELSEEPAPCEFSDEEISTYASPNHMPLEKDTVISAPSNPESRRTTRTRNAKKARSTNATLRIS
jgi:hypothetical protein